MSAADAMSDDGNNDDDGSSSSSSSSDKGRDAAVMLSSDAMPTGQKTTTSAATATTTTAAAEASMAANRDWYRDSIRRGSIAFELACTLLACDDVPVHIGTLIKRTKGRLRGRWPYRIIRLMRQGHKIETGAEDGMLMTVTLTDKGRSLYVASLLGIPPISLMILSFAYGHVKSSGFFVRNFDEYYCIWHSPLQRRQLKKGFDVLVKRGIVCRLDDVATGNNSSGSSMQGMWTIPEPQMKRLAKYDEILYRSMMITRGREGAGINNVPTCTDTDSSGIIIKANA